MTACAPRSTRAARAPLGWIGAIRDLAAVAISATTGVCKPNGRVLAKPDSPAPATIFRAIPKRPARVATRKHPQAQAPTVIVPKLEHAG